LGVRVPRGFDGGAVYRAIDPETDFEVLLTESPAVPGGATATEPERRARFFREARVLAGLRHPSMVAIREGLEEAGVFYLASDRVEGTALGEVLRRGPMDAERAAAIVEAMAGALAFVHRWGVSHRRISPASVWIEPEGGVRLGGFGVSWVEGGDGSSSLDSLADAPAYLSPERANGASDVDASRADQYGLGVLLYEMLCGRPPFIGAREVVIDAARHDEPLPPSAFRSGVPEGLERIALRAMARDPGARYPNCAVIGEGCRGHRRWRGDGFEGRGDGSVVDPPRRPSRPRCWWSWRSRRRRFTPRHGSRKAWSTRLEPRPQPSRRWSLRRGVPWDQDGNSARVRRSLRHVPRLAVEPRRGHHAIIKK
jgi:serine/threonine protein kinase